MRALPFVISLAALGASVYSVVVVTGIAKELRERQTAVVETARNRYHEAKVRLHEFVLGGLQTDRLGANRTHVVGEREDAGRQPLGVMEQHNVGHRSCSLATPS